MHLVLETCEFAGVKGQEVQEIFRHYHSLSMFCTVLPCMYRYFVLFCHAYMLDVEFDQAEKAGRLKPGDTVIEATSGNTGVASKGSCTVGRCEPFSPQMDGMHSLPLPY